MTPTLAKIVAFGLFLVMGFAAISLMLRLFVYGQRRIGNESVPMVRFLARTRPCSTWSPSAWTTSSAARTRAPPAAGCSR